MKKNYIMSLRQNNITFYSRTVLCRTSIAMTDIILLQNNSLMPKIATIERCIGPYTHTISFLKEQYLQPFGVNNCLYHQSPSKKAYSLKNHTWSVAYNSVPHIRYFHVVCIKEPSPFSKPLQHANHSFHSLPYY